MKKKHIKQAISEIDARISLLITEANDEKTNMVERRKKYDDMQLLISMRSDLANSLNDSSIKKELISAGASVGALLLVLKFEKVDVITTKGWNMVTKMFRG